MTEYTYDVRISPALDPNDERCAVYVYMNGELQREIGVYPDRAAAMDAAKVTTEELKKVLQAN